MPVTVTVAPPVVAPPVAVKVNTLENCPGGVAGFGTYPAETPEGNPEVVKVIAELNPPRAVIVIVAVAVLPCVTDMEETLAMEKSADATMVRDSAVLAVINPLPEVPVMTTLYVPPAAPVV